MLKNQDVLKSFSWKWVALYTAFLYSTIPFARGWLDAIKSLLGQNLGFWFNLFVVTGVLTLLGFLRFNKKFSAIQIGSLIIFFVFLIFFVSLINIPEERIHIFQYAGLGLLIFPFGKNLSLDKTTMAYSFGIIFLVGTGDELIQWLLPNRVFDLRDIFFNLLGGGVGILFRVYYFNLSSNGNLFPISHR